MILAPLLALVAERILNRREATLRAELEM